MGNLDERTEQLRRDLIREKYSDDPWPIDCILYGDYGLNFVKAVRDRAIDHACIEREVKEYDASTFRERCIQLQREYMRAIYSFSQLRKDYSLIDDLPNEDEIKIQIIKDGKLLTKVKDLIERRRAKRYGYSLDGSVGVKKGKVQ